MTTAVVEGFKALDSKEKAVALTDILIESFGDQPSALISSMGVMIAFAGKDFAVESIMKIAKQIDAKPLRKREDSLLYKIAQRANLPDEFVDFLIDKKVESVISNPHRQNYSYLGPKRFKKICETFPLSWPLHSLIQKCQDQKVPPEAVQIYVQRILDSAHKIDGYSRRHALRSAVEAAPLTNEQMREIWRLASKEADTSLLKKLLDYGNVSEDVMDPFCERLIQKYEETKTNGREFAHISCFYDMLKSPSCPEHMLFYFQNDERLWPIIATNPRLPDGIRNIIDLKGAPEVKAHFIRNKGLPEKDWQSYFDQHLDHLETSQYRDDVSNEVIHNPNMDPKRLVSFATLLYERRKKHGSHYMSVYEELMKCAKANEKARNAIRLLHWEAFKNTDSFTRDLDGTDALPTVIVGEMMKRCNHYHMNADRRRRLFEQPNLTLEFALEALANDRVAKQPRIKREIRSLILHKYGKAHLPKAERKPKPKPDEAPVEPQAAEPAF